MGEALNQFDKGGLIYDVIRNYNKELGYYDRISKVIEHSELNSYADANAKNWMKQFIPKLTLDHSLPDRIGLLPIEKEVFYLIHFACYSLGIVEIIDDLNSFSLKSITDGND